MTSPEDRTLEEAGCMNSEQLSKLEDQLTEKRGVMKYNEIEQAVMELCDAVPEFKCKKHRGPLLFYHGKLHLCVYDDELACIAQHAKHWAAQQGWMPYTDFRSNTFNLWIVGPSTRLPSSVQQTKWLEYDPLILGSEEIQWIRSVTEMAQIITNQGAPK